MKSWKLGSHQKKSYHPTRMIVKRNLQITGCTNLHKGEGRQTALRAMSPSPHQKYIELLYCQVLKIIMREILYILGQLGMN